MTKEILNNYHYFLPQKNIAIAPAVPRDSSRFLIYQPKKSRIFHQKFYDLSKFLLPNDLIVVNNSKVFPARLFGKKITGGKIEVLLLEMVDILWSAIIGGKINIGEKIFFDKDFFARVIKKNGKEAEVEFNISGDKFWQKIDKIGKMPIPPYIRNSPISEKKLRDEYQTVYAKKIGSAAAPTAGLHFTEELIHKLKNKKIVFAEVDLHVGLGTFLPVSKENIIKKKLHLESFSIPKETIRKIIKTKQTGGRIIAVGTTTVRALESASKKILENSKDDIFGSTEMFIQSGFKFQIVDALITNFHLPKSSLMMLVAAFLQFLGEENGRRKLLDLYKLAINNDYRFYSFGDAMLII